MGLDPRRIRGALRAWTPLPRCRIHSDDTRGDFLSGVKDRVAARAGRDATCVRSASRSSGDDIKSAGTGVVVPLSGRSVLLRDELKEAFHRRNQEFDVAYQTAAKMIVDK